MAESSNGIGGTRLSDPTVLPGRARSVTMDSRQQASGQRENATTRAKPEDRQVINLDGRSFDLAAPRGTYINILV